MMEREKPARCYRDPDNGVRYQRSRHLPDCAEPECRGCTPCAERHHCTATRNCSWHLEPGQLTCGRCVAGVRRRLRWIGDLSVLVAVQALRDGINSEAAYLAGPAADPRALAEWQVARKSYLRALEQRGRITEAQHLRALEALAEDDDDRHPYTVLTRWQMMLAEDYGHELPGRLTTLGAVVYLDRHLHEIANDEAQDFPLLRREVKKCHQHLEAVLHNDEQRDRGAPCPECITGIQMIRAELEEAGVPPEDWPKMSAPRLERQYAHGATVERYDTWRCPRVREHEWSHYAYVAYLKDRQDGRIGA